MKPHLIIKRISLSAGESGAGDSYGSLDGLKILHISDLHLSGRSRKIEKMIDTLSAEAYDLIFITGDMIDTNGAIGWCADYLGRLRSKYGTYAVIGNHDRFDLKTEHIITFYWDKRLKLNDIGLLRRKLAEKGVQLLIDEAKELTIGSSRLAIFGADNIFGFDRYEDKTRFALEISKLRKNVSAMRDGCYKILLTHVPDELAEIKDAHIDLALSGHTHGGQARLPLIGPVIVFSRFQRRCSRGLYRIGNFHLHISAGLGTSSGTPFRINCPPEATIITLSAKRIIGHKKNRE